jgi:hypothetical protein
LKKKTLLSQQVGETDPGLDRKLSILTEHFDYPVMLTALRGIGAAEYVSFEWKSCLMYSSTQ